MFKCHGRVKLKLITDIGDRPSHCLGNTEHVCNSMSDSDAIRKLIVRNFRLLDHHRPILTRFRIDRVIGNERILDYSIVGVVNGLEIVLLVMKHHQVLKPEPLFYFTVGFTRSHFRVALDEDSLKIGCLIGVVVSIDLIRVLDALHLIFCQLTVAFKPTMQGEEIVAVVLLRARPVLQSLESHGAATVPGFHPKLYRAV